MDAIEKKYKDWIGIKFQSCSSLGILGIVQVYFVTDLFE